jgi:hypothetical protein
MTSLKRLTNENALAPHPRGALSFRACHLVHRGHHRWGAAIYHSRAVYPQGSGNLTHVIPSGAQRSRGISLFIILRQESIGQYLSAHLLPASGGQAGKPLENSIFFLPTRPAPDYSVYCLLDSVFFFIVFSPFPRYNSPVSLRRQHRIG